ncbi:MAG: hypothetical protein MUF75_01795 [Bacteroidia bacterium]|nr:hypothetical protein [Bacteroidia bacterium]
MASFLLISSTLFCQDVPVTYMASPSLEGPIIGLTASHMVNVTPPISNQYDVSSIGVVRLMILPNKSVFVTAEQNMDVEVDLDIKAYDSQLAIYYQAVRTLEISNKPYSNTSFVDQSVLLFDAPNFPKIYQMAVTIQGIRVNGVSVTNLPSIVRVETSIQNLRYQAFSFLGQMPNLQVVGKDYDCDQLNDFDSYLVTWSPQSGALYYELEYTAKDNYDQQSVSITLDDFKNNSTRIVTKDNSYTVPNIFDQGLVGFRVRAFGRPVSNSDTYLKDIVAGEWSSGVPINVSQFEPDFNWNFQSSFAEDGKSKVVVNFADGSQRTRQTITKNNTDLTTIIGSSIYDFSGRPAVTVLPAPLPPAACQNAGSLAQHSFLYVRELNVTPLAGFQGEVYSKLHFDVDQSPNSCLNIAAPMANTSGASQYYSLNNPDQSGFQSYLPEADGYPYSQTEYTPDNTGRIKKQGGVGPEFQILGGHSTQYFYGAPEQIELDRLFGSEVGDASHYQKNMIIDPNGQVSITYLDLSGRTIATSLAGNAPTNLINLPSIPPVGKLTADMFNKNTAGKSENNIIGSDGESIEFRKSILVPTNNSANTFTYNLGVEPFKLTNCPANMCFNCVYDLEIKVTDDCGTNIYSSVNVGKRMVGHFTIAGSDTIFTTGCASPTKYEYEEQVEDLTYNTPLILPIGLYYVSKILRINKDARDYYLKEYLDPTKNCILPLSSFETTELNKIPDSVVCAIKCPCELSLGTKDKYVSSGRGSEEQWEYLFKRCKEVCAPIKGDCELGLNMLLGDISPNGQYGNWTNPTDVLSVFNKQNLLPKNTNPGSTLSGPLTPIPGFPANWKHPLLPNNVQEYQDPNGLRSRVKLVKVPPQTTSNPGNYNFKVDNLALTFTLGPGDYYTYPENLSDVAIFVAHWKTSWAKSLVTYHPEYCYYEDCLDRFNTVGVGSNLKYSSNDYDALLRATKTFNEALNVKQLLISDPNTPGGYMLDLGKDPATSSFYFEQSFSSGTPLTDVYNIYNISMGPLSLHEYVAYMLKCSNQIGVNQANNANCTTFGSANYSQAFRDKEWQTLRNTYLAAKAKVQIAYSDWKRFDIGTSCKYYNGCIGDPNFNPYNTKLIQYNPSNNTVNTGSSEFYNSKQPCNSQMKDLYALKVKRYGQINSSSPIDESEAEYQAYLKTGKCPMAIDFEALAKALAQNGKIASSNEPLQNYPEFSVKLYNYLNNLPNPPANYVNYLWQSQINSGVLNVNIKNSFTNQVVKTIAFSPLPGQTITWSQVVSITQLMRTGNTGPVNNFTCIAKEQTGASYVYKVVNGTTDIELGGCIFNDVCKPNDLAKELQGLMSILAITESLPGTKDIVNTTGITLGSSNSNNVYSQYLSKLEILLAPNNNNPSLKWLYLGNYQYKVFDNASPTCYLQINLLNFTSGNPLLPNSLSTLGFFNNINSAYNNFFVFEARTTGNSFLGEIKGDVTKFCNGQQELIEMGKCEKPDPLECKTKYHQTKKDLEHLLTDILLNKKYSPNAISPNNNVLNYSTMTSNLLTGFSPLASNIPVSKFSIVNNYYKQIVNGSYEPLSAIQNDSLGFTFLSPCYEGDPWEFIEGEDPCSQYTYCTVWVKTNNKSNNQNTQILLPNITSILEMKGYGSTTGSGSFQDFYIVVEYSSGGVSGGSSPIFRDTLYGSSCYEIQNCNACGAPEPVCCGSTGPVEGGARQVEDTLSQGNIQEQWTQSERIAIAENKIRVDSSLYFYNEYKGLIDQINTKYAWAQNRNDRLTYMNIEEMRIPEFEILKDYYFKFIIEFNPAKHDKTILESFQKFKTFVTKNNAKELDYQKYLGHIKSYNVRSNIAESKHLEPTGPLQFSEVAIEKNVNEYYKYLNKYIPSQALQPKSILEYWSNRKPIGSNATVNTAQNLCDSLYNEYILAYAYYNTTIPNACYANPLPPALTQQEFDSKNYCCQEPGISYFTQYISSFYNTSVCPVLTINSIPRCDNNSPNGLQDCMDRYLSYLDALDAFNTSELAIDKGYYLENEFIDGEQFTEQGFCHCLTAYLSYLQQFYTVQKNAMSSQPLSIRDFPGCANEKYCSSEFSTYNNAITAYVGYVSRNPQLNLPVPQMLYTFEYFSQQGYCKCAEAYAAFLYDVMNGKITDLTYITNNVEIENFCQPVIIPCAQPNPIDTVESPLNTSTAQNPCMLYKKELALINAKLLYEQYLNTMATQFISQYNAHCLGAFESLIREYDDKEFHYTLYYYDQAGNLIKTIPPAGLDQPFYNSIKKFNDPNAIKVKNDRSSRNKTVIVNHAQPTVYIYNSLNQLVKQRLPDHDGMSSPNLKYRYTLGVDSFVNITSSQFLNQNRGYLAGYEKIQSSGSSYYSNFNRGKVFESSDGGESWRRVPYISGFDIKKVIFIPITSGNDVGIAVGSDGMFMISADGGSNWDHLPLHELSNGNTLNDVAAIRLSNNDIQGVAVGDNGTLIKFTLSPGVAPSFQDFNNSSPAIPFGNGESITDVAVALLGSGSTEYYITTYYPTSETSRIYSRLGAVATSWTDISQTKVLGLNKVRRLSNTSNIYAVGKDGLLIKSNDAGQNWSIKNTNTALEFKDVYFADANNGVAILIDANSVGSLYKTVDGGANWVLINQGTLSKSYKGFNEYIITGAVHKLTAFGSGGLIKRVTLDINTPSVPAIGAVSTALNAVNANNSLDINDVMVMPFDNNNRLMAVACGASGTQGKFFYSLNYEENNVNWKETNISTSAIPSKCLFEVVSPSMNNYAVEGLFISQSGLFYIKTDNNTPITISGQSAVNWILGQKSNVVYQDFVMDRISHTFSNPAILLVGQATFSKFNSFIGVDQPAFMPLPIGTISPPVVTFNSVVFDFGSSPSYAVCVGAGGNIHKANSTTSNFSSSLTFSDRSEASIPSKVNELLVNPSNSMLSLLGDQGFVAYKNLTAPSSFIMSSSGHVTNYNGAKYISGTSQIIAVGESGLVEYVTGIGTTMAKITNNAGSVNLLDVGNAAGTGFNYAIFAGENGTVLQTDIGNLSSVGAVFDPIPITTEENLNSIGYSSSAGSLYGAGQKNQYFSLGKYGSTKITSWFTGEITQISFINSENGYFVGKHGLIRHTRDGAQNWNVVKPFRHVTAGADIVPDLFAVHTSFDDQAIIAGNYNYLVNCNDLILDNSPFTFNAANLNKVIYDIDLSNESSGFYVGTDHGTSSTIGGAITLNANHQWNGVISPLTSLPGNNFRALYAFKGNWAGRFLAVGENNTLKYFNGTNFNAAINLTGNNQFTNSDHLLAIDFADNITGYIGGSSVKMAKVVINHNVSPVTIDAEMQNMLPAYASPQKNINTISVVDNSGIEAFFAGNMTTASPLTYHKYNWKFGHAVGKHSTLFWYDRLGRMVVSQNAKQSPDKYSYTIYDSQGRIVEVGEKTENLPTDKKFETIFGAFVGLSFNPKVIDDNKLKDWLNHATGAKHQITKTVYETEYSCEKNVFTQENLRKRVSSVYYYEDNLGACNYDHATHYSYDISGNVKMLVQDNRRLMASPDPLIRAQRYKFMYYQYDLISGKVNQVSYQPEKDDAFYHRYEYDADNRLTEVKTSRNAVIWETDAKYFYYKHGPLARVELGHDKIQGIDYAYTLQGWIKGMNSNKLDPATDMGKDASATNTVFPMDASGFTLGYYKTGFDDYEAISSSAWSLANRFEAFTGSTGQPSNLFNARENLFNGNISLMATSISEPYNYGNAIAPNNLVLTKKPMASAYKYDQLNRISTAQSFTSFVNASNNWLGANNNPSYANNFTYDANGNIATQTKADMNNAVFDNLMYNYTLDAQNRPINNRLRSVNDPAGVGPANYADLPNQTNMDNYEYDEIGNLVKDKSELIGTTAGEIIWNVYGKIAEIKRDASSMLTSIKFEYDANGNRVGKHVYFENANNMQLWLHSLYYVRDAQGNLMATYKSEPEPWPSVSKTFELIERPIYGSNRVGIDKHVVNVIFPPVMTIGPIELQRRVGNKHFEIANHLGNVNTVVSDLKIPIPWVGNTAKQYYLADIVSSTDYYAFGQLMPGRNYSAYNYRYGFNGKENDNEVKGIGNSLDFGARVYDSRLGRFLSVDPLFQKQVSWSPYSASGNNPIRNIDVDGKYFTGDTKMLIEVYTLMVKLSSSKDIKVANMAKEFKSQLEKMDASDVEFYLQKSSTTFSEGKGGNTYFDFDKNRVVIDVKRFMGASAGNPMEQSEQARLGHELKHGAQFLEGDLSFSTSKSSSESGEDLDLYDEIEAVEISSLINETLEPMKDNEAIKKSQIDGYKNKGLLPIEINSSKEKTEQIEKAGYVKYKSIFNFKPNASQINDKKLTLKP